MAAAAPGRAQLFVKQASSYKDFRPVYPQQLFDRIFEFAGVAHDATPDLAVDLATGNGQAIAPLAAKFKKVLGLDGSQNQLKEATSYPNVEYQAADAHATGLESHSADLVTVAQAMHWFQLPKFYSEVTRILKPSGSFAAWSYNFGHINEPHSAVDQVYHGLYRGILDPYWAPERALVDAQYEGMEPGPEYFGTVQRSHFPMPINTTVEQLVGYARSWSAYVTYRDKHPHEVDPLIKFQDDLLHALGSTSASQPIILEHTITLLLAKDPVQHK